MKFFYNGHTFEYTPRPIPVYVKPRAINWRFQPPGEKFKCTPRPVPEYIKPKAMNWRFELAATPKSLRASYT